MVMMISERIPLRNLQNSERLFQDIANRISRGAVFVYPTETIYGIGGVCNNPDVERHIINAKSRAPANLMILLASDRSFFNTLGITFPPAAEKLAEEFWPGLLTLVVPSPLFPKGIGIRVSDHPFIAGLFKYIDVPIYSTSANISGKVYDPDPDHIYSTFLKTSDFMIDAGSLPPSLPSTVVGINDKNEVKIIREGVIKSGAIMKVVE